MNTFSDNNIITHIFKRLSDNQLIMPDSRKIRAIDLCRIKEGTAVPISVLYGFNAVFLGRYFTVAVRKSHTAHSDSRNINITQFSCFHTLTSFEKALGTAKHKLVRQLDDLLNRLLLAFLDPLPVNAENRVIDEGHQHTLLVFGQSAVFL